MFHIADAPCHGNEFHDLDIDWADDHPSGDKLKRDPAALLHRLRVELGIQVRPTHKLECAWARDSC